MRHFSLLIVSVTAALVAALKVSDDAKYLKFANKELASSSNLIESIRVPEHVSLSTLLHDRPVRWTPTATVVQIKVSMYSWN